MGLSRADRLKICVLSRQNLLPEINFRKRDRRSYGFEVKNAGNFELDNAGTAGR